MLAVVQLHDLCINMRFQGTIVIWQVRQSVLLPRDQASQRCYQLGTASRREKTEVVLFSMWALPLKRTESMTVTITYFKYTGQ